MVNPYDRIAREELLRGRLKLLGADAQDREVGGAAGRAPLGRTEERLAVVADEAVLLPVVGEVRVAVRAAEHMPAVGADHHRGKAPAVQEEEHLMPLI